MLDGRLQTEPVIRLRKVRGVAEVLNDTFRFLRQNYAPVGKSLLFIAGPVAVVASVSGSIIQALTFGAPAVAGGLGAGFTLTFVVIVLFGLLSGVLTATVATGAVLLYQKYGPESLDVRALWSFTRAAFGKVLLTVLLVGFMILVSLLIALVPCLGALFVFVLWTYLLVTFSLMIPMVLVENIGPIEAMERCRRLVKGHWWPTLGVLFVAFVLYTVLTLWVNMPYYIALFLSAWHGIEGSTPGMLYNVVLVAGSILAGLGGAVLYSIVYTAATIQYFSLVERKARVGLRARVEALLPPAAPGPAGFAPEVDDA